MGVMRDKGPTKPRPPVAAQRPPSPRTASRTAPTVTVNTTVAAPAAPARRKEEEKLRGNSAQSPVKSTNITNNIVINTASRIKTDLAASEAKDDEKNEEKKNEQNETENSLALALGDMSLNEDNDLNKQIRNLSIEDTKKEKEQSEESDLVSRGPDRVCTTGNSRAVPYFYQQHNIVSFDKHGGGTVLYPNISPPHKATSYSQNLHQELNAANFQNCSQDSGIFTNGNYLNGSNSELENALPQLTEELPHLSDEDLHILRLLVEEEVNSDSSLTHPFGYDIDQIIESKKDDKDIQPIYQEICEGVIDGPLPPTTPDSAYDSNSAYDSDECSVGSPSSVTSGGMRTDREKVVTMSPPFTHVVAQHTNLHTQIGFAPASISPVMQTVPVQLLVLQPQPRTVMPPPPLPQQQPQPLAPLTTPPPPLSPQVHRPILPGINIPDACNNCSRPAINRIRSVMVDQMKDRAWAKMFAYPDTKFMEIDEDGNMFLSGVLSNWPKIKNFIEVLHALIQRLKGIINNNKQMAYKLLATPNKNGQTPLDIACRYLRSGPQNTLVINALAVRYLADTMVDEGLPIGKEVDGNGNSLLHKLCAYGDGACYIMAELLSMKDGKGKSIFDVNQKNNEGKTPLHIAAQTHSDRTSCAILAQLLMRSGADISIKEGCAGNTVFHLVARESCDPNLLVMLLAKTSYGSKVINEKNFNEDTPLHMVAANHAIPPTRQRLAVWHLIESGADPKLKNKSQKTPLSLVPAERKQDIKNVLYHKKQVTSHE